MNVLLEHTEDLRVRFQEVDSLGIVWHGHYVKYFEDGREAFGRRYGIGYLDIFAQGFTAPVVELKCDYKRSIQYGDRVRVRTIFEPVPAAKLIFRYEIYRGEEPELAAVGRSVQVFLTATDQALLLTNPPFYEAWKDKHLPG